jgi:chromosome partitioning protein
MDPQANTTSGLGVDPRSLSETVYDCLVKGAPAQAVLRETAVPRLTVLPTSGDLVGAEVELVAVDGRESILKNVLEPVKDRFNMVFIDCPPALGLLTINALVAATSLLIPVQCEYYAMEGVGRLMANVERVQQSFNPGLQLEGVLLTMFDARNTLARQVSDEIRGHFKEKVYKTMIPRNVALAEAPSYGKPAALYNAAASGAQAYLELAKEFLSHGEEGAR